MSLWQAYLLFQEGFDQRLVRPLYLMIAHMNLTDDFLENTANYAYQEAE